MVISGCTSSSLLNVFRGYSNDLAGGNGVASGTGVSHAIAIAHQWPVIQTAADFPATTAAFDRVYSMRVSPNPAMGW